MESFIHLLIHWFIDWRNQWFIVSLIHWFIDSSTHSFTQSLIPWFIDSLVGSCIDSLTHWTTDSPSQWFTESSAYWCIDHDFIDSLIHWCIDSLIDWFITVHSLVDPLTHCFVAPWIPSFSDLLTNHVMGSSIHWFIGSSVHSLSCSQVLSCHVLRISNTISSFGDAPHNFSRSWLLHLKDVPRGHCFLKAIFFFRNFRPGAGRALPDIHNGCNFWWATINWRASRSSII